MTTNSPHDNIPEAESPTEALGSATTEAAGPIHDTVRPEPEYVDPNVGNVTPPVDYGYNTVPQSEWAPLGSPAPPPYNPYGEQPPQPFPPLHDPQRKDYGFNTAGFQPEPHGYVPPVQKEGFFTRKFHPVVEAVLAIASVLLSGLALVPVVFILLVEMQERGVISLFTSDDALKKTRKYSRIAEIVFIIYFLILTILMGAYMLVLGTAFTGS